MERLPDGYHLSSHLTVGEIKCRCGCGFGTQEGDLKPAIIRKFEQLRKAVGLPLHINSGCRCAKYNRAIGGSKHSAHIEGLALDIRCPDKMEYERFYELAERIAGDGGCGYYPKDNFVHIDARTTPPRRRWGRKHP